MLPLSHHSKKEVSALKTLDPWWEVPPVILAAALVGFPKISSTRRGVAFS